MSNRGLEVVESLEAYRNANRHNNKNQHAKKKPGELLCSRTVRNIYSTRDDAKRVRDRSFQNECKNASCHEFLSGYNQLNIKEQAFTHI